ncbi:MAG: AAA family ATPase [Deltaproteobacteria bacterium]|nr:AAA family ATPase [Deltaproteobacteria bacterium]
MRCAKCGAENSEGKRFCGDCGAPLENRCAQCGADNPAGKRFCGDCGAPLAASGGSGQSPDSLPPPTAELRAPTEKSDAITSVDGERRHLTVLFTDLVGSTEIAAHLDAEDWREVAAQYQRTATAAVARFGGHVAKYLGDGLMVYFGWPQAHEDDAERAVRAGLAMVEEVTALNGRLSAEYQVKLAVRVGIQTGSVVMGRGGGGEADVFGDVPNVASRVQSTAEPDSVVITAEVHKLVAGLFVVEDYGAHQLKGIEHAVQLYRATQPTVVRRRAQRAAARSLTPFVGREDDMRLLLSRWERAREGQGQLVLVMGEPGIGKSRLVEEFRGHIRNHTHVWVECAGERLFQSTPFHAVTQLLGQGLGWRGDESPEDRVSQLERSLKGAGLKLSEAVPLIAELLDLPKPENYPPVTFTPDQRRKRLLANLVGWVLNFARVQPLILAIEDLHWVDPSTLELTQTLVEQAATAPLMLLCTGRPEFRAPWPMRAHHTQVTLNRLNERHTREMVIGVVARSTLAPDLVDEVVKRTDGVPLFAEELTRLILEGDSRSPVRDIPTTLHDSLTARLDKLGPAKEVAQVAAVIGREFSYGLLRAVVSIDEAALQSALQKLLDAELIYARGIPPEATYQFKHALIRDSAYEVLLKAQRKKLHGEIASVLERDFALLAQTEPEVLAIHHSAAGDADRSSTCWKAAGERAVIRGAFPEAKEYYNRALAELTHLEKSPALLEREMLLWMGFGHVSTFVFGYAAPETLEAYAKARALGERIGNPTQLLFVLAGLHISSMTRGEKGLGQPLADELQRLATRDGGVLAIVWAHTAQTMTRFYSGDFRGARDHALLACSHYRSEDHLFGPQDPGVLALGHHSWASWELGDIDLAREQIREVISIAQALGKPNDLAFAEHFATLLSIHLRDAAGVRLHAAALASLVARQHFPFYSATSQMFNGWVMLNEGRAPEALAAVRKGVSDYIAAGTRIGLGLFLGMRAVAEGEAGLHDEALGTVRDALESTVEEGAWQPYLMWVQGKLLLEKSRRAASQSNTVLSRAAGLEQAEQSFRDASALAARIVAKTIQLRATTSLANLLITRGSAGEARDLLGPVYSSFTQGHDTPDLIEARQVFDELESGA